jgi:hypothetical protein
LVFNDDYRPLTMFASGLLRVFELIVHLIQQNKVTWSSVDTRSSILESHCSDNSIVAPTGDAFVPWMGVAVSETRAALAGGGHYREMAERLRGLAHLTRSPGIRRELVDLAKRYDRRGDHFDRQTR